MKSQYDLSKPGFLFAEFVALISGGIVTGWRLKKFDASLTYDSEFLVKVSPLIQSMAPVNCRNCATNFPPLLVYNIVSLVHMTNALVIICLFSPDIAGRTEEKKTHRKSELVTSEGHPITLLIEPVGFIYWISSIDSSPRFGIRFAPKRPRAHCWFRYDADSITGKSRITAFARVNPPSFCHYRFKVDSVFKSLFKSVIGSSIEKEKPVIQFT